MRGCWRGSRQRLDPIALNGWAMLGGGALLLAVSAPAEDWAGAALYDERVTLAAVGGAVLVAAGLAIAQWPGRRAATA